jgi:hypothetical protein
LFLLNIGEAKSKIKIIMVSKVKNQDWLTQLREKNKNIPVIDNSKNQQKVTNNLYLV